MVRNWDWRIDELIIDKLMTDEKAYFNQLLETIEDAGLPITKRKLSNHLQRLNGEEIIVRDNFKPGVERFCKLTPSVIIQRFLDFYVGVKTQSGTAKKLVKFKDKYLKQTRNKKAVWLLFGIASEYSGEHGKGKQGPNEFCLPWSFGNYKRGVSISDVVTGKNSHFAKKYFLDDFSSQEVSGLIERLRELGILIPVEEHNGDIRFDFTERYKRLSELVVQCNWLVEELVLRLIHLWVLLRKKPTSDEIIWFYNILGEKNAKNFLLDLNIKRAHVIGADRQANRRWRADSYRPEVEKSLIKKHRMQDEKNMDYRDTWIKDYVKGLEQNYGDVKENHRPFYDIAIELVNPPFLHKDRLKR